MKEKMFKFKENKGKVNFYIRIGENLEKDRH